MDYGFMGWAAIGLVAGALAKWIMPGRDPGGLIVTILIGVAGALLGGVVGAQFGAGPGSDIWNVILATCGAVLLLWLYRVIRGRR